MSVPTAIAMESLWTKLWEIDGALSGRELGGEMEGKSRRICDGNVFTWWNQNQRLHFLLFLCAKLPKQLMAGAIETCGYDLSVKFSYFIVIFNLRQQQQQSNQTNK